MLVTASDTTQRDAKEIPRKRKDSTVKLSEEVIIPVPFV